MAHATYGQLAPLQFPIFLPHAFSRCGYRDDEGGGVEGSSDEDRATTGKQGRGRLS